MTRLRIATCATLPEPDIDEVPLAEALARAGVAYDVLAWDDPAVDWSAPAPTLIRSTWNYAVAGAERFSAWLDVAAAAGPLWNPAPIAKANLHKRYLVELAARGVPVVPTTLVERGEGAACDVGAASVGADRVVIKPEVGAGSLNARVFASGDPSARMYVTALAAGGAVLVQPYMSSIEGYGERALVFIDGALSHAIRKSPRFAGGVEQVDGGFTISDDERAVATAALAPYPDLLYARVDVVRDRAGRPCVMELELVEPSLFFVHAPGSADRFVAALRRRLGS
jgi:hypothetical protein